MKKAALSQDKENRPRPRVLANNPITDKMNKFGKSIRAKLSAREDGLPARQLRPLCESAHTNIIGSPGCEININKIQNLGKMSSSVLYQSSQPDETSLSSSKISVSRNKSVRFADSDRTDSMSLSKSVRKGQSILKNSNSSEKLSSISMNSHIGSIADSLSVKASLKDTGIGCDNKKYENLLKILAYQDKKFFDDMFPPGEASLFHSKKGQNGDIRWMRLQDTFRNCRLVLLGTQRNAIKPGQFEQLNYMVTCFNALGTSNRCLERIFQQQQYSKHGIYYLRLNHEGVWRYVVVDNYIPVRQVGRNYVPVFMGAKPSRYNQIEIWPFLLQKALAKMYSTYQCLFNQSVTQMMQDLTGFMPEQVQIGANHGSAEMKLRACLMNQDDIVMGVAAGSKGQVVALKQTPSKSNSLFTQQAQLEIQDTETQQNKVIALQDIGQHLSRLVFYHIDSSYYSVGCVIKQQRGAMSLRTFRMSDFGSCQLSVIQKDRKYYRNNGYAYCWMRLLLVCKDIDGYRYIGGAYSNQKTVALTAMLNPGDYFVLVSGDWGSKVYDVTLNYQGNAEVDIRRQQIAKYPDLIDEMGRDIAQRFGQFVQMNKNVCCYQHVDRQNGLVIQNFNNQQERQVYFHRIYRVPFKNYVSIGKIKFTDQQRAPNKKVVIEEVETFLEAGANRTLILMLTGGVDEKEVGSFSFSEI